MSSNNTALEYTSVSGIMIADVKTAHKNQSIHTVCKIMHENKIGSIVILDNITNNKDGDRIPTGIITERDIVRLIGLYDKSSSLSSSSFIDRPVSDVMSTPLTTINPNSSLRDAIQTMQQKDIRRLPVVDNRGKMLGIVTSKDIFMTVAKNQALVSGFVSDPILVDQQPLYGRFTDYLFKDIMYRS
ncbi:MAG TPA: CBS domain-containing protein [Nitrososphaeraceae archaeon]